MGGWVGEKLSVAFPCLQNPQPFQVPPSEEPAPYPEAASRLGEVGALGYFRKREEAPGSLRGARMASCASARLPKSGRHRE